MSGNCGLIEFDDNFQPYAYGWKREFCRFYGEKWNLAVIIQFASSFGESCSSKIKFFSNIFSHDDLLPLLLQGSYESGNWEV